MAAAAARRPDEGCGHDPPGTPFAIHHQPDPGHRPAGWPARRHQVVATSSQVDALAVTPQVEAGGPPVVDQEAGAGAVWAVTSGAGLLRIDPRTARLTASLPGPVSAVATGAGGVLPGSGPARAGHPP